MLDYLNVVKSFGTRTILHGLSFSVSKGSICFILGTSGTGKSVLLKNTVGLMKPDSGQILLEGKDIVPLSEDELGEVRRKCGMVFQQPALLDSLSVFDNVAFGLRRLTKMNETQIRDRVIEALTAVNMEKILTRRPSEISYGMQKRVSLARTLALEPQVLLFDEPTTGLDPQTTRAVNDLIYSLSRKYNTSSLVVSHDMACALAIADQIVVLDKGSIVDMGTPKEIRQSQVPLVRDFMREVQA